MARRPVLTPPLPRMSSGEARLVAVHALNNDTRPLTERPSRRWLYRLQGGFITAILIWFVLVGIAYVRALP